MADELVRMQAHVTFAAAEAAVQEGLRKAQEMGVRVGICVTDAHGDMVMFVRMDGAPGGVDKGAKGKARFAASIGRSTHDFIENRLKQNEALWRAMSANPDVFIVPGGFPMKYDGRTVGGVGVSGAKHEEDSIVSQTVADAFNQAAAAEG